MTLGSGRKPADDKRAAPPDERACSGDQQVTALAERPALPGFTGGVSLIWEDLAGCKGRTALFFAPPGERPGRRLRREAAALAVCHTCPVMLQCRETARESRENGIWGGETEEDRAIAGFAPRAITRRAVAGARHRSETPR